MAEQGASGVYGVHMIAPEEKASCCDDTSRSARSGLIRGLRGEAPFDGNRFPPLMWGGTRVAAADVQFIADWIDDGCPAEDHASMQLDVAKTDISRAQVIDLAEFEVRNAGARGYAYRDGEPRQRANLDCLSEAEVDRLRDVFRKIYGATSTTRR
jgi:tyrosinase